MIQGLIAGALVHVAGSVVSRTLVALGVSYVTYLGVDAAVNYLHGLIESGISGLPSEIVAILALCQVGTCISIYIAALTADLVMNGLNAGTFKRLIWN